MPFFKKMYSSDATYLFLTEGRCNFTTDSRISVFFSLRECFCQISLSRMAFGIEDQLKPNKRFLSLFKFSVPYAHEVSSLPIVLTVEVQERFPCIVTYCSGDDCRHSDAKPQFPRRDRRHLENPKMARAQSKLAKIDIMFETITGWHISPLECTFSAAFM